MLQTLEGVRKVPLFPKAGQGFDPEVVKSHSTVTIAYDAQFRIIMYCSKPSKRRAFNIKLYYEQLLATMSIQFLRMLRRPPSTDKEARLLSSGGIPAITGRKQTTGGTLKKRDRAGSDGGGGTLKKRDRAGSDGGGGAE